ATSAPILRVYWNVSSEGAICLTRLLTGLLNGEGYPFRLKMLVLEDRGRLPRCDGVVLYIRRADWRPLRAHLAKIHSECTPHMGEGTPALTKVVGKGLAVAEDPGGIESFGQHRCRLIAEGLFPSYEAGVRNASGKLEAIARVFTEYGLDLNRPHLSPG